MLSRRGISLRVRRIGSTFVQTVKTMRKDPGGAKSRGEWEWPITSNKSDIWRLAETPVDAALTAEDLAALAEVVLDQGEILADSAREPIT